MKLDQPVPDLNPLLVQRIVRAALEEDIGPGDITTEAVVPAGARAEAVILAKEEGVIAGLPVAEAAFRELDPNMHFTALCRDGDRVSRGQAVARVEGSARAILTAERVALNLLQRLSGVATITARLCEKVRGTKARLVDTRKTTPGLRALEKYAVRAGGGSNHRLGLYDAILIKDNHIVLAGGIPAAVAAARARAGHTVKIEVEVETLAQLDEALAAGADIILLDNMDIETMCLAVQGAAGRALLEASGGITEATVAEVARTGVDVISVGALTHSVKALDLSLEVVELRGTSGAATGGTDRAPKGISS